MAAGVSGAALRVSWALSEGELPASQAVSRRAAAVASTAAVVRVRGVT